MGTGLVFIISGILSIAVLSVWWRKNKELRENAIVLTQATVANTYYRRKFRPVYAFSVDGVEYKVESAYSSRPAFIKDGTVVEIYYVFNDPNQIFVPREQKRFYFLAIFLLVMGVVCLRMGMVSIFGVAN